MKILGHATRWLIAFMMKLALIILYPIAFIYEVYMNLRGYEWNDFGMVWVSKKDGHVLRR